MPFWSFLDQMILKRQPGSFRRLYVSLDRLDRPSSSVQLNRSKAAQKPFRSGATKSSFFSVFRKCRAAFVHWASSKISGFPGPVKHGRRISSKKCNPSACSTPSRFRSPATRGCIKVENLYSNLVSFLRRCGQLSLENLHWHCRLVRLLVLLENHPLSEPQVIASDVSGPRTRRLTPKSRASNVSSPCHRAVMAWRRHGEIVPSNPGRRCCPSMVCQVHLQASMEVTPFPHSDHLHWAKAPKEVSAPLTTPVGSDVTSWGIKKKRRKILRFVNLHPKQVGAYLPTWSHIENRTNLLVINSTALCALRYNLILSGCPRFWKLRITNSASFTQIRWESLAVSCTPLRWVEPWPAHALHAVTCCQFQILPSYAYYILKAIKRHIRPCHEQNASFRFHVSPFSKFRHWTRNSCVIPFILTWLEFKASSALTVPYHALQILAKSYSALCQVLISEFPNQDDPRTWKNMEAHQRCQCDVCAAVCRFSKSLTLRRLSSLPTPTASVATPCQVAATKNRKQDKTKRTAWNPLEKSLQDE